MKCEYFSLDYWAPKKLGQPHPVKTCNNEAIGTFDCGAPELVVCAECSCRCYKNCTPWTEEEMKEYIEAREERWARTK